MNNLLNHIAIIMDGNGRWAKKQDQKRTFGHFHGAENVRNVAIAAQELGIKVLTLFAFSTEIKIEFFSNLITLVMLFALAFKT